MKLLADECCEARVVATLREDGHDVILISMGHAMGETDVETFDEAKYCTGGELT